MLGGHIQIAGRKGQLPVPGPTQEGAICTPRTIQGGARMTTEATNYSASRGRQTMRVVQ